MVVPCECGVDVKVWKRASCTLLLKLYWIQNTQCSF